MKRRQYRETVGPGMRKLLLVVLVLFALLVIDSVYLGAISFLQWHRDENLENGLFQFVFLVHLTLGIAIIVPTLVYSAMHLRRAFWRPNRIAVRLGLSLLGTTLVLFVSGILLTRGLSFFELQHPASRTIAYWLHVAAPFVACWLFILHRLAGKPIRWTGGIGIATISVLLSVVGIWVVESLDAGDIPPGDFSPSLARTANGGIIDAELLMTDDYCAECHDDIHEQWQYSAHRFASFNNPAYLFSVRNTREMALARDGDVRASRFCAGCHDPVPLFSGAFDEADFDDVKHPTAQAGITCVACHSIESLSSPRGNADYVISTPEHYPFAMADSAFLRWINSVLIKGNPAFHKHTFLKDFHEDAEFCATCHKVHLPEELNKYKWLRGQNHYDSFLLSGVSGHGVQSFYYPEQAEPNCNGCHMPFEASSDIAATTLDENGDLAARTHNFPSANTALPHMLGMPSHVNDNHRAELEGSLRVDIFGVHKGADISNPITKPIRPEIPAITPGETYVFDVVLRNLSVGHLFTEGTADSNEAWLEVSVQAGDEVIGRSGSLDPDDKNVDPWAHFVNAYVLDRDGNRIDRRNAEDIFTKLYDHQIPPGAADVIHYKIQIPEFVSTAITVTVNLHYRKFDTTYLRAIQGSDFRGNDLPITTIASDSVVFPVSEPTSIADASDIPEWQRWNDYGIGFLRKPDRSALRQAENAFQQVAALGRADGPLNLARTYISEGRLDEASEALHEAAAQGAYPWSVAWFGALVDMQNGEFDAAIEALNGLLETRFEEARRRGFDFSRNYRLHNTIAQAIFENAKFDKTPEDAAKTLELAASHYQAALRVDPENLAAHYGLAQIYARLDQPELEAQHRLLHSTYKPDDNAHDSAIGAARRRDAAANHASEAIVINNLQREEALTE